jgi:hypothetical protein
MPGKNGGKLQVGNPGNKGGGRPADEFKRTMAEIASSDRALKYLRECVEGKHGPKAAVSAHKHATDRGYGKEMLPLGGPDGGPIEHVVTRKVVHAGNRIAAHVNGANGDGRS